MAKKPVKTKSKEANPDEEIPEGFEPASNGKIDGWFTVAKGNTIQGVLLDAFTVKGKFGPKRVYKIAVTSGETEASNTDEGDFTAGEGAVIGLDEKGWLKGLATIKPGTEIYVKCTGQEATAKKGQQPAWKFVIGTKKASPQDESDVPF